MRPRRVVAFGGGRGLSTLLAGLARSPAPLELTAIVAASDDGGSTGRLRSSLGIGAVGDLRRCLSAVAIDPAWERLFERRFARGPLKGHPLGNLMLAAGCEAESSLARSVDAVGRLVGVGARLLPATDVPVRLVSELGGGRVLRHQAELARGRGPVLRVRLDPVDAPPSPGVLDAIAAAHVVLFAPGSLFSSVIASALPAGISRALAASRARKFLVQNLTTERGETDGFRLADHVRALTAHLGPRAVDAVVVHGWGPERPRNAVDDDVWPLAALGLEAIRARVATDDGRRHHPQRLARVVERLAFEELPRRAFGGSRQH